MTTTKRMSVFCLIVLLTTTQAYAGPLSGVTTYITSNLVNDIETLAIIAIAFCLFAMHINWWMIIGICAGIWILANPTTLTSVFSTG